MPLDGPFDEDRDHRWGHAFRDIGKAGHRQDFVLYRLRLDHVQRERRIVRDPGHAHRSQVQSGRDPESDRKGHGRCQHQVQLGSQRVVHRHSCRLSWY